MKRVTRAGALMLAILGLLTAASGATPNPTELRAGGGDPRFHDLFQVLAGQGSVRSSFTENRWFPFRRVPVVLHGEMRFSRDWGLSLHYARPEERTLVADRQGLVLRDGAGRSRTIRPDESTPDIGGTLVPILRFDEADLYQRFRVFGAWAGESWRLEFLPRSAAVARWVGKISVEGRGRTVLRIEFRRSANQRIEIEIDSTATGVVFGPAERQRFFR